jgi:hypothetical protein
MNDREQRFMNKFTDAARHLGSAAEKIVSLKVREDVGGYHDYRHLLQELEHEAGIRSREIQGAFAGGAYLLENSKTKVIVVEHETGLEVLYIAGSVASLISLIPMILKGWSKVRHYVARHHDPDIQRIETRRFDGSGHLIEDHNNALAVPWSSPLGVVNTALLSAAEGIDEEVTRLREAIRALATRVAVLEIAAKSKPKARQKKTGCP